MQRFVSEVKWQWAYCCGHRITQTIKTYSYVFTFIFLGADVPEGKQGGRDQLREPRLSFQPVGPGAWIRSSASKQAVLPTEALSRLRDASCIWISSDFTNVFYHVFRKLILDHSELFFLMLYRIVYCRVSAGDWGWVTSSRHPAAAHILAGTSSMSHCAGMPLVT